MMTYGEREAIVEPIAKQLERIAYRLRQGAIPPDRASAQLAEISLKIVESGL